MKTIIFLFGLALFIAIIMPTKGESMAVATPAAEAATKALTGTELIKLANQVRFGMEDLVAGLEEFVHECS